MNIPKFIIAILLIIPGAFMVADSILVKLGETVIFFPNVNTNFELVVGFALIVLGASQMESDNDQEKK